MMAVLLLIGFLSKKRIFILFAIGLWLFCSAPIIADRLIRIAENWAERIPAKDAPQADVIVVLSAGRTIAPGVAAVSEWSDADRFYAATELYNAGKASYVIFTGGLLPWETKGKPEGEILIDYAKALGLPAKALLTTGVAMNTEQEAMEVKKLLAERAYKEGVSKILLVTSAMHMPRAASLFKYAGLDIIPFPVDFQVSADLDKGILLNILPHADAFSRMESALRELYGRAYYFLRYKLT